MKKLFAWLFVGYVVYGIAIAWYLYVGAGTGIPQAYKGTAADPNVFMNARQIELSYEFSRIKNILFFLSVPFEWLILFYLLASGVIARFYNWATAISKNSILQKAIFLFYFTLIHTVFMFPLSLISYFVSKEYGITIQSFSGWMKDNLLDYWLNYGLTLLIVIVLYALIKRFQKRWWLYAWILSIPFTLFLMFIQPVVIDPLYHDFYPLKNKELEDKILALADRAEIPAERVYEVNMSEKTNALNAYVTGIGSNARIVLWDTTINKLTEKEILVVMAHEMAHYVKNHVFIGMSLYLAISLIGLFITAKLMNIIIAKWGDVFHISNVNKVTTFPLMLLLFSILSFSISPLSNAISRHQEHVSDVYALEMTNDTENAIKMFQKLTVSGLQEVNPPVIVKWFKYGHPTMLERINYIEESGK